MQSFTVWLSCEKWWLEYGSYECVLRQRLYHPINYTNYIQYFISFKFPHFQLLPLCVLIRFHDAPMLFPEVGEVKLRCASLIDEVSNPKSRVNLMTNDTRFSKWNEQCSYIFDSHLYSLILKHLPFDINRF